MRIVIDMQGAQTESRFRGIGRYSLSFAQATVRNRGEHEIFIALSGLFPDTIEPIRAAFEDLLPQENIRVWCAPGPVMEELPCNHTRRDIAELTREAFLASLAPDVIHISSLFEGYVDDAVTSIGRFDLNTPVSVSLYDLIPLLNPDHYLQPNPDYRHYYLRKVEHLKKAAVCLAISESSRQEGCGHLAVSDDHIINVSTAIDSHFQPQCIDGDIAAQLRHKFGLTCPFVLYTGGADKRKNLPRLIQAFAALPKPLRMGHQLLLAGKMSQGNIVELQHLAKSKGLKPHELRFTGYVADKELIQLYNLCALFVFPSWHEGFGLPALEAMACGAPVIGANTSSLPELIASETAMFDPFDIVSITVKMSEALEDEAFCMKLRAHGLQQAKRFSWDESSKKALAVWESLHSDNKSSNSYLDRSLSYNRLLQALAQQVSAPEAPELTELAICLAQNKSVGTERQLMLDVSELTQRDSATGVQRVVRSYLQVLLQAPPAGFRIEPVYATVDQGYRYARNFTQGFLGQRTLQLTDAPVQWQRGDIFFGLDMQHHVQLAHKEFYRQLQLEGVTVKFLVYDLLPIQLVGLFKDTNAKELHEQWLAMISTYDGAICISKATADAFDNWISGETLARTQNFQMAWVHIGADIDGSKPSKGLPEGAQFVLNKIQERPSFLSVATLEPRKGQQQIVGAIQLLWNEGLDLNLVLVGQQGWEVKTLAESIRNHPENGHRLFWLQGISDEYLEQVYSVSTCLIAASINEGFGLPLIEAARHGTPIIARDIPVFHEVAGDSAFYFRGDASKDLADAIKDWLSLYHKNCHPKSKQMHWLTWQESAEKLKTALIYENIPKRQLLVDVSELVQRDVRSGIQRVVRSILKEWLMNPPSGYRVEPVYGMVDQGYRYARRFTQTFFGYSGEVLQDEPIEYAPGDIFLGLDLQPQVVVAQQAFYQTLRRYGVQVTFVVYDILGILMPQHFPVGAANGLLSWLQVVTKNDGVVCISQAVANEVADWVKINGRGNQRPFRIDWFHLGADICNSLPTGGLPNDAELVLHSLHSRSSFLMVGTLEPRKGHAQVLEAFEHLWQAGTDVNLVVIGKQGWMVEKFTERLLSHPECNKRLFWLEGISDEYLEKVYAASTCLIAASYGEGFGLPLIEASQHKLPIIARDIPVFRQVAGNYASYFSVSNSMEFANLLSDWLTLYAEKRVPLSEGMPFLTWKQSAERLKQLCIKE